MNGATSWVWPEARVFQRWSLVVGAGGLGGCGLGAIWDREQFFHSYLLASMTWLGVAVGSLALLMLHHLTGGIWGLVIRRLLEAATCTVPLLAVLFVPLAFGLADNYPWARAGDHHGQEYQAHYLNVPFFLARAGIYFAVWLALTGALNWWSAAHDRTADPAFTRRMQLFAGPGLVLYGLTVTFAAIDWIMSLDPHWASTIFGPLLAVSQMLPALALAIAVATCLATRPPLAQLATAGVWNDLGNLLLAFVMLWTYMSFSQFLLIWSGNLPEEITWYMQRSEGGWQFIAIGLAAFYFALPFLLLLSRTVKRDPARLRLVAGAVVFMTLVHHLWLIAPNFSPRQFWLDWMDVAALAGVGGLWLTVFLWLVQFRPLLPVHDPQVREALGHA